MKSLWAVCTVLVAVQGVSAQFDMFGVTSGHGSFFGFGATADPYGYGGGGTTAPTPTDPSARDARMTAAEEQMAEAMSETGKNSPERRRIEQLLHLSGGRFAGDAANLNYLVEEFMMTTPGPSTPSPPPEREGPPPKKKGAVKGKGRGGGGGMGKRGGAKIGRKGGKGVGGQQRGQRGFGKNQQGGRKGGQGQGRTNRGQRRNQRTQQKQFGGGFTQQPLGANPSLSMRQNGQWGSTTLGPWADQPVRRNRGQQRGGGQFGQGPANQWGNQQSGSGASLGQQKSSQQQSVLAPGDPAPGGMSPAEFDRFVMEQWSRLQANIQQATKGSNNMRQKASSTGTNNKNQWNQPPPQPTQMNNNNHQTGNSSPGNNGGTAMSPSGWDSQSPNRNGPGPSTNNFGQQSQVFADGQSARPWNEPAQSNWGPPQNQRRSQYQGQGQNADPSNGPPPQRRRGSPNRNQTPGAFDQAPQHSQRRQSPNMAPEPQPIQQTQQPVYQSNLQPSPQPSQQPTQGSGYQQQQLPPSQFRKQPSGQGRQSKLSPAAERLKRIQARIDSAQEQLAQAQANPQNAAKVANIVSQIEALKSVRSILTGNANKPTSVQTLKQIPNTGAGQFQSLKKPSAQSSGPYPSESQNTQQGSNSMNMPPPTFRKESSQAAGAGLLKGAIVKKGPPPQRWGPPPQVDRPPQPANSFGPPANYMNNNHQPYVPPMPQNIPQSRSLRSTAVPKPRRRDVVAQNRDRKNLRYEMNQSLAKTGAVKARMLGRVAMSGMSKTTKILSPVQMDGTLKSMGHNATTKTPIEGETRMIGSKRYVFTDADGFDTFQWVLNTGPPPTQKPAQSSSSSPIDQQTSSIVDVVPLGEQPHLPTEGHIPTEQLPKAQII